MRFFYILITFAAVLGASCSQYQQEEKGILPDEVFVDQISMNHFLEKYSEFIDGLSEEEVNVWSSLSSISNDENYSSYDIAGVAGSDSKCTCGEGMGGCSADGQFSSCCICWDPNTQHGACGVYFGIATCRTANIEPQREARKDLELGKFISFKPASMSTALFELQKKTGTKIDELVIENGSTS